MPRILLLTAPLAAVAACGSPATEADAPANTVAAPLGVPGQSAVPETPAADAAAAPRPGELRTFNDWTVGCDNAGNCKAVALAPEDSVGEWPAFLPSVERDAGAGGTVRIVFSGQDEATAPIAIAIDGKPVASGGTQQGRFEGVEALRIAEALAQGSRMRIESAGKVADVSLRGASAALRYMDAEQGRADSAGALVAKGARPDNSAARALPVIRAAAVSGTPATITPALAQAMRDRAGCESFEGLELGDPEAHALSDGRTLALVPCSRGAYNAISAVFVVENGTPRPAGMDWDSGMSPEENAVPSVVNGAFENGVLTSYAKGRGLGDCGTMSSFVWNGTIFRLSELSQMGECRGSTDYITTWRTRVER